MQHVTNFKITGMQMDPSMSAFDSKYSYKNMNIRILSKTDEGTVLSAVNEQGTLPVVFEDEYGEIIEIQGNIIGQTTIDDTLILFTTSSAKDKKDCIYKARLKNNTEKSTEVKEVWQLERLYSGNLNFDLNFPIECLPYYENQNIKKVYWVDGRNQPRVINVMLNSEQLQNANFDFVPEIVAETQEIVQIDKVYNGGEFTPGTIQFVFCYIDMFGNELPPFYISDLQYIAHENRGENPSKTVTVSFNISIFNINNYYSKIRIYSIHRDYKNGTPNYNYLEYTTSKELTSKTIPFLNINRDSVSKLEYIDFEGSKHSKVWINEDYCGVVSHCAYNSYYNTPINYNNAKLLHEFWNSEKKENYINNHIRIRIYDKVLNKNLVMTLSEYNDFISTSNYIGTEKIGTSLNYIDNNYYYWMTCNFPEGVSDLEDWFFNHFSRTISLYLVDDDDIPYVECSIIVNTSASPTLYIEFSGDRLSVSLDVRNNNNFTFYSVNDPKRVFTSDLTISNKINKIQLPTIYKNLTIVNDGLEYEYVEGKLKGGKVIIVDGIFENLLYSNNNIISTDTLVLKNTSTYAITPATIISKDNTLFLGNYKILNTIIDKNVESSIQSLYEYIIFKNDSKHINLPKWEDGKKYIYTNQLYLSSSKLRYFKYDEWYRFGIKLIDKYGNSTVIYLGDKKNNINIEYDKIKNIVKVPHAELDISTIKDFLIEKNIIKVQPLVVYPDIYERRFICQGAICPTIYNKKDRDEGIVYAQSSWIHRPINPKEDASDNPQYTEDYALKEGYDINILGALPKYKHGDIISKSTGTNCEIFIDHNTDNDSDDNYYIDQNTITLHSPDIEFDKNLNTYNFKNCKLRIIGVIPIHANSSYRNWEYEGSLGTHGWYIYTDDIDGTKIIDPDIYNNKVFNNKGMYTDTYGNAAFRKMISNNVFFAGANAIYRNDNTNHRNYMSYPLRNYEALFAYPIFLYHPSGYISNQIATGEERYTTHNRTDVKITNKLISNLQYSYIPLYFANNNIKVYTNNNLIYNYSSPQGDKITTADGEKWYYGNIKKFQNVNNGGVFSKVLNYSSSWTSSDDNGKKGTLTLTGAIPGNIKNNPFIYNPFNYNTYSNTEKKALTHKVEIDNIEGNTFTFIGDGCVYKYTDSEGDNPNFNIFSKDYLKKQFNTVSIEYNSTAHCVLNLGVLNNKKIVLPELQCETLSANRYDSDINVYNDIVSVDNDYFNYGFVYLGELYNDDSSLVYKDIKNIKWLPCGETININEHTLIKWTDGDIYYQRYDNLKTYSPTIVNANGVVDILSFMCETRVNLDGRYDRNKGQEDNTVMNPTNFNLINDAYTQDNNYFTYNYLDYEKRNISDAFNQITWGLTKIPGSDIDNWLNINLISVLNLDGSKGGLCKLDTINNTLLAFQENAISEILYNTRTQISTTSGVPIELTNSGKVDGYRIISNRGVYSKYHILNTGNNLYFIDSTNRELYSTLELNKSISSIYRISSWLNNVTKTDWKPNNYSNSWKLHYDFKEQDVYIINKDECLGLSEVLGSAQSFYSYEGVDWIFNIEESTYCIKDNKIYKMHAGEYNTFFGTKKPYYLEYVVNDNPNVTKIFDSIEYVGDTFKLQDGNWKLDCENTFDRIEVFNEYQYGEKSIHTEEGGSHKYTDLKRKYRQWRAILPREKGTRNRIVNPWIRLKISKKHVDNERTVLHFLNVKYSTIP